MPTYRNNNNVSQPLNGKVVEPGQDVCSLITYDENEIKMLKVSDRPFFNPTIYSGVITKEDIIKIPRRDAMSAPVSKYAVHFYVEQGCVDIRFNSLENNPCLSLYEGAKWNMRCFDRNVDTIYFNGDVRRVWVIIEKI